MLAQKTVPFAISKEYNSTCEMNSPKISNLVLLAMFRILCVGKKGLYEVSSFKVYIPELCSPMFRMVCAGKGGIL